MTVDAYRSPFVEQRGVAFERDTGGRELWRVAYCPA